MIETLNYIFAAGINFSHVIGYIVSGLSLIFIYKYWNTVKKDKLILLITLFMLYGFIWAVFCSYQKDAFEEMFTYLTSWLFPFILGFYITDKSKKEKTVKIYFIVFTAIIFFSFLAYFGLFFEEIAGAPLAIKGKHLKGLLWHISCGAMCVLFSCFTLVPLLFKENLSKNRKFILALLTVFFITGLYLTGSRGYYIAGFAIYILILIFYIFKTRKLLTPLIIFALCAVIITVLFKTNNYMQERIENTSTTKEWSLTSRIHSYNAALAIYKHNFIFGCGPRQGTKQPEFIENQHLSASYRHLHSMYLAILAEFGTVGFILFAAIMFLIFKRLFLAYKKEGSILALCLFFAWISFLIGDCFDTVLRGPRVAMDYFWLTGLILLKPAEKETENKE